MIKKKEWIARTREHERQPTFKKKKETEKIYKIRKTIEWLWLSSSQTFESLHNLTRDYLLEKEVKTAQSSITFDI